ncbi:MAG: tetratricopeptide repeat protein [Kofleriaceae bacterium]
MNSKLVIAALALSTPAFADKADEVFKQAKKLMAEKKYAEACPKFEKSYQMDPGIGGQLNVGKCYEEWGKLGKAYRAYSEALKKAEDTNDNRAEKIKKLVAQLEPQVPRLVIHVPPDAETTGLQVAIDGVSITVEELAKPQLVDPGPKQVEYALGSGARKTKIVPVERGGTSEITLELPKTTASSEPAKHTDVVVTPKPDPDTTEVADDTGHGQRVAGIAIAGVGVVGLAVGSYLALSARGTYNDALSAHCMNMTNACDAQGLTDTHDARSRANTATIIFSVGVAATVAGIVVYVIAPKAASNEHAFYVVPTLGETTGFAFGGRL